MVNITSCPMILGSFFFDRGRNTSIQCTMITSTGFRTSCCHLESIHARPKAMPIRRLVVRSVYPLFDEPWADLCSEPACANLRTLHWTSLWEPECELSYRDELDLYDLLDCVTDMSELQDLSVHLQVFVAPPKDDKGAGRDRGPEHKSEAGQSRFHDEKPSK